MRVLPATTLLALLTGLTPGLSEGRDLPPSAPTEESAASRKAVRGAPTKAMLANESPELRALKEFESRAFPSHGSPVDPNFEDDTEVAPLPPGLPGSWGGTGDIPRVLRSPERTREPNVPAEQQAWLKSLALPELPVRWEPQVLRYLDFFKNDSRGRSIMTVWLRRMGRYRALIERICDQEGVPRDLIFLAMVESGFDPGAVSPKAAGGLWQFIPSAGRAYGLEVSHWVDARRDPEQATVAAVRYLKDLNVRFGSWYLAFASYNAGYGAILRSIARFNTNDFWELARNEAGLPWETSLYVPKILAAAVVGRNLAAFGFANLTPDPAFVFDRVEVPAGTSFAQLAKAVGTKVEVIEELNPELIRGRIPPDRDAMNLRVPVGTAALYASALNKGRPAKLETIALRFGETLDDVAKSRGISPRELRRINGILDRSDLRGGTTILVPVRPAGAVAAPAVEEAEEPLLVPLPERTYSYDDRERVFYRTKEGDTVAEIASVFDVTVDDLVEWNHVDPDAKLQPRLVLQVFVRQGFDPRGVVLLDPEKLRVVTLGSEEFRELDTSRRGKTRLSYAARAGDTLAKIAKRYGLSQGDLARINRLSANSELTEGQRIIVYSPTPELPKEITAKPVLALKDAKSRAAKGRSEASSASKANGKKTPAPTSKSRSTPSLAKGKPSTPAATKPAARKR
jgi:membrane-bound lytic murein transglycosylase D